LLIVFLAIFSVSGADGDGFFYHVLRRFADSFDWRFRRRRQTKFAG
jgi:hypothetical protein